MGILLLQRGIDVDVLCKRCSSPESVFHVLPGCPFSIKVWILTPLLGPTPRQGDIFSFLSGLKVLQTSPQLDIMVAALYSWVL